MIRMTSQELAEAVKGRLQGAGDVAFEGVFTDTREPRPGALFIALKGPNFDAHTQVAADLPAPVLLVERALDVPQPQVIVSDTREALGRLGRHWRRQSRARVIALTGSNGKTTTKEMLRCILEGAGSVHATAGNLNNEIGAPLTLLAMPQDVDYAVIELGANHAGEIGRMVRWVEPQVAMITNAGRAHLEGFGSLEGVAHAKAEIYSGLPAQGGTAVVNLDDPFADYWLSLNEHHHCQRFSLEGGGEVEGMWQAPDRLRLAILGAGRDLRLAGPGRHLAANAVAAAAAANAVGIGIDRIVEGLAQWKPVRGRLQELWHVTGARLWDDSYNANPDSLRAGLEVLAAMPGRRILVLGAMGELGSETRELHRETGRLARAMGIDHCLALGDAARDSAEAFGDGGEWFADHGALQARLEALLAEGTTVLVKGSRSQHMERIIEGLDLASAAPEVADALRAD
ncbi:UDP-N-acetylmuramoyl-tripeptide--D-alanyl-D-alanine ligase [Thioalkalivibrio sp. ALE31]|uniref:UDP-N-acetylmuramoyl-tripeptide--D-alanyl-D- alanine ligase n=1 Tax=Thioalkalivibrio sp. ALE31 TaxID=1158182 RepID=UPI00036C1FB0|nr:UDP-N-acetylmuramoyl-tripeptide--D-alanyl-D-alanine ligase [Thioalkalivibrio sp. ALE31]